MRNKHTVKQTTRSKHIKQPSTPLYCRRLFLWIAGIILGLIIIIFLVFKLSPWPSTILVRTAFNHSDRQAFAALAKHTPATPITVIANQHYKPGDHAALLDVYIPQAAEHASQALPVVIWTHGGAWVSGDKADDAPYFKLLAAQGFVVVSLNYTLAPAKAYPAQIFELNAAHAYIVANANKFHVNPDKIVLAGDSAGAQLTSEMDTLITNPAYASEVGIKPTLHPSQLVGTVLFCGIYVMKGLTEAAPNLPKLVSWGDDQVVWAFSGTRNDSSPIVHQMSPYYYVTKDFPVTFISGGNSDPLTTKQSIPLAAKLQGFGVPVSTLFYAANHQPKLPHEYQFNLDTLDGRQALAQLIQFLQKRAQ